jgi:Homeobox KN domain
VAAPRPEPASSSHTAGDAGGALPGPLTLAAVVAGDCGAAARPSVAASGGAVLAVAGSPFADDELGDAVHAGSPMVDLCDGQGLEAAAGIGRGEQSGDGGLGRPPPTTVTILEQRNDVEYLNRLSSASSTESSESLEQARGRSRASPHAFCSDEQGASERRRNGASSSADGAIVGFVGGAKLARNGLPLVGEKRTCSVSTDSDETVSSNDDGVDVEDEVQWLLAKHFRSADGGDVKWKTSLTWRDATVASWRALARACPGRSSFARDEIVAQARNVWVQVCGKESLSQEWRNNAVRALGDESAFRLATDRDYELVELVEPRLNASPRDAERSRGYSSGYQPETSAMDDGEDDGKFYAWHKGVKSPPTWRDTAVAAYMELKRSHPERVDFAVGEITHYVSDNWNKVSWSHHRRAQWRGILRQEIRAGKYKGKPVFVPSARPSAGGDHFALVESAVLEFPSPTSLAGKLPSAPQYSVAQACPKRPAHAHPRKKSRFLVTKREVPDSPVETEGARPAGNVATAAPVLNPRALPPPPSVPIFGQPELVFPKPFEGGAKANVIIPDLGSDDVLYIQLQSRKGQQPRSNLPKGATATFRAWAEAHAGHPYPSEEEKWELAYATGTTINQIQNWFINHRKRVWKPASKKTARESFSLKSRALLRAASVATGAAVQNPVAKKLAASLPNTEHGVKSTFEAKSLPAGPFTHNGGQSHLPRLISSDALASKLFGRASFSRFCIPGTVNTRAAHEADQRRLPIGTVPAGSNLPSGVDGATGTLPGLSDGHDELAGNGTTPLPISALESTQGQGRKTTGDVSRQSDVQHPGLLKLASLGIVPSLAASGVSLQTCHKDCLDALDIFVTSAPYASLQAELLGLYEQELRFIILDDKLALFVWEVYTNNPTRSGFTLCHNILTALEWFSPLTRDKLSFSRSAVHGWSQMYTA